VLRLLALFGILLLTAACAPLPASTPPTSAPVVYGDLPYGEVPSIVMPTVTAVPALACHLTDDGLPDPVCTPGALNPNVTQANLAQTICLAGWTDTIRPPTSYTNRLKRQQLLAYGLIGALDQFEEDHKVPLGSGGHPTDVRNLWPEPIRSARLKDALEVRAQRAICAGSLTLAEAQAIFLDGAWLTTALP
jgi:hypothetical protein